MCYATHLNWSVVPKKIVIGPWRICLEFEVDTTAIVQVDMPAIGRFGHRVDLARDPSFSGLGN